MSKLGSDLTLIVGGAALAFCTVGVHQIYRSEADGTDVRKDSTVNFAFFAMFACAMLQQAIRYIDRPSVPARRVQQAEPEMAP